MSIPPAKIFSVFLCVADQDRNLYAKLEGHLSPLNKQGGISCWSNQQVLPGQIRKQEIALRCQKADLFLLLISPDFYTSQECQETMRYGLQRSADGSAIVIPILLSPFDWKRTELGTIQVLPKNQRPVTTWPNRAQAFHSIAEEIGMIVEALRRQVVIVSSLSDQTFTRRLTHNLTEQNISLWKEIDTLESADLKDCIRGASVVVIFASRETHHSLKLKNVRRLSDMYRCPIVDVLVSYEEQDGGRPTFQQSPRHEYILVDPRQETSAFENLYASLNKMRFQSALFFAYSPQEKAEPNQEPRNPYKGLRAFTADDARDFFGREKPVQDLVNSLQNALVKEQQGWASSRFLTIIGPSGSGKSSIAMAGLLPHLQKGIISGSQTWRYLTPITPGAYPLQALASAFAAHLPMRSEVSLREDLEAGAGRGLHILARQIAPQPGRKVVLFIDQFEELFTQTTSPEERQCFIDLIVRAASEVGGPVVVILTLRADFYDRPMSYPELSRLMQEHLVQVLPMEIQELRAVIEKPALFPDVQLTFEGNLVGDMLYAMWGQAGALPLLQFTLEQLFEHRSGHVLTLHAYYKKVGGIKGALKNQAERVFEVLCSEEHRSKLTRLGSNATTIAPSALCSEEHQIKLIRALFLRLINFGATEQDTTRRRASSSEFMLNDPLQTGLLSETINAFIKARLLTSSKIGETTTLEISHEALIQEWPQLSKWLHEAREDIRLQHIISEDVIEWKQHSMPKDRLYRGNQLSEAQAWAARNIPNLDEIQFLQGSDEEQNQQAQLEQSQLARELKLQHQVVRRQKYVISLSGAFLLVLIIVIVLASNLNLKTALFNAQNALLESNPASVTNTNDHGPGSLRDAIFHAQAGGSITFARNVLQHTIVLTGGEIQITRDLIINGPGASKLSISGNGKSRVFNVNTNAFVTIVDITIKDGHTADLDSPGGCLFNSGDSTMELINSTITHCEAVGSYGGGIANKGILTLTSSVVSDNSAFSDDKGERSGNGGGITNDGTLTINNSTISQNRAKVGGGIAHFIGSSLILQKSTVSDNNATVKGGGIYSSGGFTIQHSTISDNRAMQQGGGIFATELVAQLQSNTIFYSTIYNDTANEGGGLYVYAPFMNIPSVHSALLSMTTSIIAGNKAAKSGPDLLGPLYIKGDNLIQSEDSAGKLYIQPAFLSDSNATDSVRIQYTRDHLITGKSPNIGPLSNYKGSTKTHALSPGSVAIDAIRPDVTDFCQSEQGKTHFVSISSTVLVNVSIDQRGSQRPSGKGCDLGAYELWSST